MSINQILSQSSYMRQLNKNLNWRKMKSDGIFKAVQFVDVFWAATPYNVADGCECPHILPKHIIFIFLHKVSTHLSHYTMS